ncbi:MAG: cob(I)yrinic acid a,c-diamide adenosyltransferase [Akkermansiaceae bacterium]|nr:cob(I)yrinic acid a,c-diamide adenosyltransferase [Armatimonadota bacterium]
MKIYTRTGDTGDTGLYGGQRVSKDDVRVESYGAVDEANAALGVAAAHLTDNELIALVARLQSELFVVGADLATPLDRDKQAGKAIVPRIGENHVAALEPLIDTYESELAPLRNFILPGGNPGSAYMHLARTILRRAERRTVTLLRTDPAGTNEAVVPYLNRLADLLFVLSRVANHRAGVADVPWTRE